MLSGSCTSSVEKKHPSACTNFLTVEQCMPGLFSAPEVCCFQHRMRVYKHKQDASADAEHDAPSAPVPTPLAGGECCLRQLDVSFNRLGDEGAAALAGLVGSTPLVALELEGNQVGRGGGCSSLQVEGNGRCMEATGNCWPGGMRVFVHVPGGRRSGTQNTL